MINGLISAISVALYSEFGYENHMEEIKQGLKEPCFFISCLNPTTQLFFGKRYFRQNKFCIQYFPQSKISYQSECNGVAETLTWTLEYVSIGGTTFRGTKMNYEVIDGVLNFFVNYDCFVYKVVDEIAMEAIDSDQISVKG